MLGSIGRSTVAATPAIQYLFIDGGCLRQSISEVENNYAGGVKLDVDYAALTAGLHKVFYYDALPSKHAQESDHDYKARLDATIAFHDRLGALNRFHVYEGDTRRSPSIRKQEQKKVDVMIAGGAEATVCELGIAGFCASRALSTGFNDRPAAASRPAQIPGQASREPARWPSRW